jgi:mono/diheme cytochrome c family protein
MSFGRPAGSVVLAGGMAMCTIVGIACSGKGGPGTEPVWVADAGPDGQPETGGTGGIAETCTPAPRASEDLSPRVDVTLPSASVRVVKTSDLYIRFNSVCGRCHVSAANGGFQVTPDTFATVFDASRLARIESEDPSFAMPPEGKAFSSRPPTDPVRVLASYLEPWLAQGRPVDMFIYDGSSAASDPGSDSYAYSAMTNLGDCVPSKVAYASSPSSEMEAKDAFFASATALPGDLTETDLTTLDTATLAANGLIAYRPTYPLWSDGSGKLRFIRVPKGTSIKFDKAKQTFDIPPNTRFYKTFFREVIDKAGRVSHKKMETRLIVSRPDTVKADGSPQQNALFGTYVWSDDEMSATLLDVPYRDGTGFADRTAEYITNEVAYQDVVDNIGPGAGTLASKVHQELLDPRHAGLVQHYAIPGSLRCTQCHQGSPTQDFVLGFYPLQVAQRAANTGGTYDPVDADELNQLQRFIDYGLITDMTSPSDVVLLESSQAPRHNRTPEELKAQAYMIGNCAHCHNPRGYPSLAKPELLTALNFLPGSAVDAGIFEFPFEKMSPLRARGANQDVPIPYITPSLRDYPVADVGMIRVDNLAQLTASGGGSSANSFPVEVTWSPKYAPDREPGQGCSGVTSSPGDVATRAFCGKRMTGRTFVAAPWRSILYRNVDTPFPYFDDYVPFPHMPMNSAGFDCRAPRIMAEWMVGLPAILKPQYRDISEDNLPLVLPDGSHSTYYIDAPQPYQEVKPTDDGYADAQAAAMVRMKEYHDGVRYQYCQDSLSTDILDPVLDPSAVTTAHSPFNFYPLPDRYIFGGIPPTDPSRPGEYAQPAIGVPYHSEWFDYDPTDPAGAWQPRRGPIWKDILVDGKADTGVPKGTNIIPDEVAAARKLLNEALQTEQLTDDLRQYATTEIPYALWQSKPECNAKFSSGFASGSLKKVSDFSGGSLPRPAWMNSVGASLSPDAPVYMASPGEALYRHICFNCHGPKADGKGLQGDALAASSEGQARPANFAAGLFGPPEMPGANLINVFGLGTGDPKTADTWAPRYMAWMTLGGTLQLIPHDVINQVEATRIFGVGRQHLSKLGLTETASANMLNLAKGLCALVLPDQEPDTQQLTAIDLINSPPGADEYPLFNSTATTPFIRTNGDWEMWMKLCSAFNRQVVRVYQMKNDMGGGAVAFLKAMYYADDGSANPPYRFPADGQVWDHNRQQKSGVSADNYYPACVQDPTQVLVEDPSTPDLPAPEVLTAFLKNFMPKCPTEFLKHSELLMWSLQKQTPDQIDNLKKWALSGAINAGMSVFSFLEKSFVEQKSASSKTSLLPPYYNECQLLP